MKLCELDLEQPARPIKTSTRQYTDTVRRAARKAPLPDQPHQPEKRKIIHKGEGFYANVYQLPKKTNTVVKIGQTSKRHTSSDDPYLRFVHAIQNVENPYFPQIYNVRIMQDPEGRFLYKVMMERLRPLDELSQQYGVGMLRRTLGVSQVPSGYGQNSSLFYLVITLSSAVESPLHLEKFPKMDPQLYSAVRLLNKLYRSSPSMANDVGLSNVMWRPTSYGPQLVFTDPFS